MKIIPCDKCCSECGFVRGHERGTLQRELLDCVNTQTIFPCHIELIKVTGSENTGVELYTKSEEVFRVCRGYLESMAKSGVEARYWLLQELLGNVSENMTDGIMSIDEACEYHGIKR